MFMQKMLNHPARFTTASSLISIFGALYLSACNSDLDAQASLLPSQDESAEVGITPTSSSLHSAASPSGIGKSCAGKSNTTCLAIRFVTYMDSDQKPTASPTQAATIIRKMNQLYSTCHVNFQIDRYEAVDPEKFGLSYGSESQNEVNQIRKAFSDIKDQLLAVTTGPWGTAVNGWTNMPGEGIYGAIMEASIVNYANGIIYAHEFGHYLGLDHTSDTSNLMNPVIYSYSTELNQDQCQTIKETIQNYWSAMIR